MRALSPKPRPAQSPKPCKSPGVNQAQTLRFCKRNVLEVKKATVGSPCRSRKLNCFPVGRKARALMPNLETQKP